MKLILPGASTRIGSGVIKHLSRYFNPEFAQQHRRSNRDLRFQTLKSAVHAFLKYKKAQGGKIPATDSATPVEDAP